jgi:RNA polymerase sigma-70 factor (ECF subfamily)
MRTCPSTPARSAVCPLDPHRLVDHLDRLRAAARALCGSGFDPDDLVQETLVRVLARPRVLYGDDPGYLAAYLLSALRATFHGQLRAASRRPRLVPLPAGMGEIADRRYARPDVAAEARAACRALASLPGQHRDVLGAVAVAGLSYREAAELLGIPEGTVMSRLHRARRRLAAVAG